MAAITSVTYVDPILAEDRGMPVDKQKCQKSLSSLPHTAVVAVVENNDRVIALTLDRCTLAACDNMTDMGRDHTRHVRYLALDPDRIPYLNGAREGKFSPSLAEELERELKYIER